jgi:hypothetical protein
MIDPRIIEAISEWVTAGDDGNINGIREDAPKEAKEAYEKYLKYQEYCKRTGSR